MKMTSYQYSRLHIDCESFLHSRGLESKHVTNLRDAWTVFARANGYWLYNDGLNDTHIETALKRMFSLKGN